MIRKKVIDSLTEAEKLTIVVDMLKKEYDQLRSEGTKNLLPNDIGGSLDWFEVKLNIAKREESFQRSLKKVG